MSQALENAYKLGADIAAQEYYMSKTASPAAFRAAMSAFRAGKGVTGAAGAALPSTVRAGWKYVAKPLLGMGEGKILPHATGAVGFGLMSMMGAEDGTKNKLEAFAGGALGGLAFTGASKFLSPLAKRMFTPSAGKIGAKYYKGLSGAGVKEMKGLKDAFKATESQIASLKNQGKAISSGLEDTLKAQRSAYNSFLKSNNLDKSNMWARDLAAGAAQFRGTAAAGIAGLGGGMYLSGIPEDFATKKQVVMYQNNMFSPGYQGGTANV